MQRGHSGVRGSGNFALRLIVCVWVLGLLTGFGLLARERFTPMAERSGLKDFPSGTSIGLSASRPTLLLFLHPHCPCSRATLRELTNALGSVQEPVDVTIVFTLPPGVPAGWEQGDLWQTASAIPGARLLRDVDGAEANRFHAVGSGQTLLFLPNGRLVFNGGITGSRGHEGDNAGLDAVVSLIDHGHSGVAKTPVFGCALL